MNPRISPLLSIASAQLYRLAGNAALQKYAPVALTWTMIAAFCWLLAYWTWILITPAPQPVPVPSNSGINSVMLEPMVNAHLFGVAAEVATSATAVVQLSALGLKLRGVFAGKSKTGAAAIINVDQKDKSFRIGDEVATGVVLTHIYPDYVELSYQGASERLMLERSTRTDGLVITPPPPLSITPPQNTYTGQPALGVFP